jgi:hypothetical protein
MSRGATPVLNPPNNPSILKGLMFIIAFSNYRARSANVDSKLSRTTQCATAWTPLTPAA